MKIVNIVANPKPTSESSSKLEAQAFFDVLEPENKEWEYEEIDLYQDPPPFYDYDQYRYFWAPVFDPSYDPTEKEKRAVEYAQRQARIFNEADILVLTAPMWNFGIPGILKTWIDQVLSPGLTFTLGTAGVKGLHKIKKVLLMTSSGGVYGKDGRPDTLLPQVKSAFGFVGIDDVDVVWADGQNPFFFKDHEERKSKAIEGARDLAREMHNSAVN